MSRIIVLGAGIVGLSTAMLLSRQGHAVTVFEHDPTALPSSPEVAWKAWERRGVAQFRQPHYLHSAARQIFDRHLPEVKQALLEAGCIAFDPLSLMPPSIADRSAHAGDERFITLTGRRPTFEYAFAQAAGELVQVERGVSIAGLLTGASAADGIPHVNGVRTSTGNEVYADLVVDATGRRSKLPEWLEAIGARPAYEEAEESSFFYYSRFFRAGASGIPAYRSGFSTDFHSFSVLCLPGDSETWSVTVFFFSGDSALKALRDPRRWNALVKACPSQAHWVDGEPITDVVAMGGISNRYRRFVLDGSPVATGIVAVGDAWGCTNPIGGRGVSMGLMHAVGTAEVVSQHLDDPVELALEQDRMTEARVAPWYRSTVEFDRGRAAQINAVIQGRPAPATDDRREALGVAMLHDASLFRAAMEIVSLLALPNEVMARPGVAERISEIADHRARPTPQGPSREELLRLVA
jgi:2-polyprenyl-6-methoxyphenol hydroxylase-like FAD-dependent oxidoreductase